MTEPSYGNALQRLRRAIETAGHDLDPIQLGGRITEVTPTHYCVSGLSRFLKLGECVSFALGGRKEIGEVVRLDASRAIVKPFEAKLDVGLGTSVYRVGRLAVSPHPSWKGRVINALGDPI